MTVMMGSSPLARGPPCVEELFFMLFGLIPARAGTTDYFADWVTSEWAHPRSRGDHPGVFQASLRFVFTEPKRGALFQGNLDPIHAVKPDIDKLTRAVFDSLTSGGIIEDDARCHRLEATKEYGDNPGVHIHLTQIYNERKR